MLTRRIILAALALAVANAIVLAVREIWVFPVSVGSGSMRPALEEGDLLLVDRMVELDELSRGDIVVAEAGGERVVKRVVGLPGETVQGSEQVVAVNLTDRLDEPWAHWGDDDSSFGPIELADDEIWLMGDDRDNSEDSRSFGPVAKRQYQGRVLWRFWPLDRLGTP